ncbi:DHH family phosphoesterase [Patescibacteria group bacterium]|nr:DHH family phosphoesterase [Patescibacteria group bacterium]
MSNILITSKINPDLDGFACVYAYSRLLAKQGQNVTGSIFGIPHVEAQYIIDRFHIDNINYSPHGFFESFILVDTSDISGMPNIVRTKDVIEVIDHRKVHITDELFPNAKIQIEKVGASATQIIERYQKANIQIDEKSAILLYSAIYSNTLNLKATISTQRDRKAIDWLQKQALIPNDLIHDMFIAKTEATKEHLEKVLHSDYKEFLFNSRRIGIVQLEVIQLNTLVQNYLDQILAVLNDLKEKHSLEFIFLTAIDLEQNFNLFITDDSDSQLLLSKIFKIKFKKNIGKKEGMLLRKQVIPLLLSHLK